MPRVAIAWSVVAFFCWILPTAAAMSDKDKAELATAVTGAKVTLEQGLAAGKANGKPVSGKFEIENGKPQLSIYTVQDGNTLAEIVKAYRDKGVKVTVQQVLDANPGLKATNMKVGQKIFIPKPKQ